MRVKQLKLISLTRRPSTVLVIEAAHLDQRMKLAKLFFSGRKVAGRSSGTGPMTRPARRGQLLALARSLAKEQGVEFEIGRCRGRLRPTQFEMADISPLRTNVDPEESMNRARAATAKAEHARIPHPARAL